jgi:hypothetical protein
MVNFNILLLGQDEAVLGMTWLREYNLKIDWITRQVEIADTKGREQRQKTKMIWYRLGAMYEEAKKAIRYVLKRYHKYKKL